MIGSINWMEESGIHLRDVADGPQVYFYLFRKMYLTLLQVVERIKELESEGKTVVLFAINNNLAGFMAIADQIKPEAISTIKALSKMNILAWMVTGDNKRTAHAIAKQVGIEHVFAEVLPSQKSKKVSELQTAGHVVGILC